MDGQVLSWQAQTLGEVLERQARERGSADALVTQVGRFSFKDMLERAKSVAGGMQALGIGRGDHVGILMGNDEKWLSLFYGAALIGAVTVPVNTRFKAAEIEFCLKQAECKAICEYCQVLKTCRTYGLNKGRDDSGIWGGLTKNEREREIARQRKSGQRHDVVAVEQQGAA